MDPEGQPRGYGMTSLQTVPCHSAGILALSCWKRKCLQQSDTFAGNVGEGLHRHSVGLLVTAELLCKLNKPLCNAQGGLLYFKGEFGAVKPV